MSSLTNLVFAAIGLGPLVRAVDENKRARKEYRESAEKALRCLGYDEPLEEIVAMQRKKHD